MTQQTTERTDVDIVIPSHSDRVVAGLSEAVGGPLGRHASLRKRFWTPLQVALLLTTLVFAFNWVQKSPCRDGAWENYDQYRNACYTDVLALYYAEELNKGYIPYLDHEVEYPVLTGIMMGVIGLPVHALVSSGAVDFLTPGNPNEGTVFYDLTALALAAFGLVTTWAVVRSRARRPWDGVIVALAPAVFVTATVNWDYLAIALTALAILAWSRQRPGWAGVFFGLATAAKFYPLLILGPLVLLCLRRRTTEARLSALVTVSSGVFTWLVINVPFAIMAPNGWSRFFRLSSERPIDWGTFWYIGTHIPVGRTADGKPDLGLPPFVWLGDHIPALNASAWVLYALCCIGIAALIMFAPRRPRLGAMAFLVVATFLLTNKVWSQQFVLWLVPLAVLARPKWRAILIWQACELAYFFSFYQILIRVSGGKSAVLPEAAFTLASIARWLSVAVLCGLVVREALRPELDVVRQDGVDDPEGGVLDETPPPPPRSPELEKHPVAAVDT
ncbi:glycosyltransferase family 87 protein [Cryptosporangium minutisporangium]|uniref:Glycosyltransferase 87 family protein n=1 Tax=Cryptosporangium minutisporangium TaxID=113569 RepID=A0ABP6T5T5_9ACTN